MKISVFLLVVTLALWSEPTFADRRKKRSRPKRAPLSTPVPAPEPVEPEPEPDPAPQVPMGEPEASVETPAASGAMPLGMTVADRRIGRRGWLVLPTVGLSRYLYNETARADFQS